jgi:predicted kinase
MNKKIIIIEGYLASGKSTFAIRLSRAINVPYLVKDTFKSALCTNVPLNSREESSRFSVVTFNAMMYVTERLIETGYPVIIEGNFVPAGIKKQMKLVL